MKLINKITFAVCGLALNVTNVLAAENSDMENKVSECNQLVRIGKAQNALDISTQLIKQNKTNRNAYACKGRAELALDQFPQAIDSFKQVKQLSVSAIDKMVAQALLGNAYKSNNQTDEALESYKQALEISKTTGNKGLERVSHEMIASALFLATKYDEAISEYQLALKLAQNDGERAQAYERLAECYEKQAKRDLAIEFQVKASLAHTKYSDMDAQVNSQLELGRMYIEANLFDQAKSTIDKVLALAQGGSEYWEAKSYIYLARLMHAMHNDKEATDFLVKADKLNQKLDDKTLKELILATALSK